VPTPAYIDTALYLPAGGVNGFEVNGFAVNGVGFVDSPFAGVEFGLDPFRSILPMDRAEVDLVAINPSVLFPEHNLSVQGSEVREASVWAARGMAEVGGERQETNLGADPVSLALEVEDISVLPPEYRTSYVLATHPSTTSGDRRGSSVGELPPSQEPDQTYVSVVRAEDRTSKVRRI
jgi:hypothetical protein